MEIISLGETLEIPRERLVTLVIGDIRFKIACTPENLRELAIGFLISEGLVVEDRICVKVEGDVVNVKSANLGCKLNPTAFKVRLSDLLGVLRPAEKLPTVSAGEKFTLEECSNALEYLETEWYKRTRGYHTTALVGKNGVISKAYDVGRYNAIDKAIGMGIEKHINFGRVFLLVSGRISEVMVAKCVRCSIPLLVSKAAIYDSAIRKCMETGLSAVSFATGIAVKGEALLFDRGWASMGNRVGYYY